ncbi:MAG: hypothetical protein ACK5QT_09370 [Oligoflexia bacterium]
MSQEEFPNKWYLDLEGKRMGPFSSEQILGLLSEGEIPENLIVIPAKSGIQLSMTAAELRHAYYQESRIPTATLNPAPQDPPDAPPILGSDSEHDLVTARRLFDLFQSAREKRAARFSPTVPASHTQAPSFMNSARLAAASVAAFALVATGVWKLTGTEGGPERDLAQTETPPTAAGTATSSTPSPGLASSAPTPKPKPTFRNGWKPGKTIAKAIPPPRLERRTDTRDDESPDRPEQKDRPDEREARRDTRRDLDRREDATESREDASGYENGETKQPPPGVMNQMATDAGILQPVPPVPPNPSMSPEGVPLDSQEQSQ